MPVKEGFGYESPQMPVSGGSNVKASSAATKPNGLSAKARAKESRDAKEASLAKEPKEAKASSPVSALDSKVDAKKSAKAKRHKTPDYTSSEEDSGQ